MFEIFISSQLSISIYIPEIKDFLRRAFKIDIATIFFLVENKNIKLIRDFLHKMSSEMVNFFDFKNTADCLFEKLIHPISNNTS